MKGTENPEGQRQHKPSGFVHRTVCTGPSENNIVQSGGTENSDLHIVQQESAQALVRS